MNEDSNILVKSFSNISKLFTNLIGDYISTDTSYDTYIADKPVRQDVIFTQQNDFDQFINMKGKKSFLKMYVLKYLPTILILLLLYIAYLQVRSIMGQGPSPKWGLIYIPLVVLIMYNMFNMFSVIKISF